MSKNTKECPFCHEDILADEYDAHLGIHTSTKEDGQMRDHVSLKEEERYSGSLDNVPQVYHHPMCGGHTGMPEFIIRSYLANPTTYNNYTFCTGCNAYVHSSQLFWVETGENVMQYRNGLLKKYFKRHPFRVLKSKLIHGLIDLIRGKKPMKA
jgi:hypothetical protein